MDDSRLGRAIRAVRLRRGWRQGDLAVAAGVSAPTVSRIESGRLAAVDLGRVRRVADALGMQLELQPRWRGSDLDRLLNARHSAMHEAIASLFARSPGWVAAPEVSFSIYGERGIVDVLGWHAETRSLLVMELKTDIVDVQEMLGTLDRKRRLARRIVADRGWTPATVSAWLVVAEGRTNRRRVSAHRQLLSSVFTSDGRTIGGWLARPNGEVAVLSFLPIVHGASIKRGSAKATLRS
ncbi:MAG TPA: helix-turn-helix transcriptional regulator [Candidatus Limnocylindrales bacterium]|nr:helix-turn-helix transcriptional regulator [Candidatus Limnocylindrales bacterium]